MAMPRILPILLSSTVAAWSSISMAAAEDEGSPLTLDLGDGISVTLYGYVKADFIWDRGYDLGATTFPIQSMGLPDGPAVGDFDTRQLNETRIGIDVEGPNDIFARFEGDFYGADDSLRLRHAYVSWSGLLVGQNWTNFMSVENLAPTVDFQGPGALPFARLPQLRYTYDGVENVSLSASVEEDVGNPDDYAYTLAARYGFETGMVRVSGLWRDANLDGTQVKGWGLNFSGVVSPWSGGTLMGNITTGDGISDILSAGLTGDSLSLNGSAVGVNSVGLTVSHQVNSKFLIAATGSWVGLDQAFGSDTKTLESLHLSAFYTVFHNTTLMAEFFTANRKQGDGQSFDTNRVQLAIKYDF